MKQFALLLVVALASCTPTQLDQVRSASEARDQLCTSVAAVSSLVPDAREELRPALDACMRGDEAKAIAASLAQCEAKEGAK